MKIKLFIIIALFLSIQSCDNSDATVLFRVINKSENDILVHAKGIHHEIESSLLPDQSLALQLMIGVTTSPTVSDEYFSSIDFDTIQIYQNGNLIEKDFLDRENWVFENHEQDFGIYELTID
ncbi:MAG: hypothetical protein AAF985_13570 [Bacteroidota bacterium]